MTPCRACGATESPLVNGLCLQCRGLDSPRPKNVRLPAAEPYHSAQHDEWRPSTFIVNGILCQLGSASLILIAQGAMRTFFGPALVFCAVILLSIGSVLVSVGTIRWAIWPLIEWRRDRN